MSEYKSQSFDSCKEDREVHEAQCVDDKGQMEQGMKSLRGYSAMGFLRKGRNKRKPSRSSLRNLSKDFHEHEKVPLAVSMVTKKCEVLGFEEVSNEFTCTSSISESYQLKANKESRYSFRKLDDGTFAIERRNSNELNPEKCEPGTTKRSKNTCHQKGRYAYKPLKICFKKRSKALKKSSDANEDNKQESKCCPAPNEDEGECAQHSDSTNKTWANFKKMVTRRKKLHSSLNKQSHLNCRHQESNTSSSGSQCASSKKRFSNLKMSCMTFSRGKKSLDVNIPPEEPASAIKTGTSPTEPASECERSDKALAIKYKLQRSLDAENGQIANDIVQCSLSSTEDLVTLTKPKTGNEFSENTQLTFVHKAAKEQTVSSGEVIVGLEEQEVDHRSAQMKDEFKMTINCKELPTFAVEGHAILEDGSDELNTNVPHHNDYIKQVMENQNREHSDASCHSSRDGWNTTSLMSEVSSLGITISDPYEVSLMITAASLVKKVIQSSIQQLVDEGSFLDRIPRINSPRTSFC
ncbi:A-kinase anchor protein 5 [Pelodytes ibericus]